MNTATPTRASLKPLAANVAARAADMMSRARARLLTDDRSPWFGTLALRLNLIDDRRMAGGTAATDGTRLYYAPGWVCEMTDDVLETVIAHEVLHCSLLHPWRLDGRDLALANIAMDHVVNLLLKASGFTMFRGALCDARFTGMAFEQVYAILDRERRQQQQQQDDQQEQDAGDDEPDEDEGDDTDADDGDDEQADDADDGDADEDGEGDDGDADEDGDDGEGEPDEDEAEAAAAGDGDAEDEAEDDEPKTPGGVIPAPQQSAEGEEGSAGEDGEGAAGDQDESDWIIAASQAAQVAQKAGDMSGGVARAIEEVKRPEHDAWAILRQFVEQTAPSDYSWVMPNRRFAWQGLYLPGVLKENMPRIGVAVDTSGSITPDLLNRFGAELTAIMHEYRPEAIEVLYCDSDVNGVEEFRPDDPEVKLTAMGGGGTRFQPALDYFSTCDQPPACVVYLTDLVGENTLGGGPTEPEYPVLWATTEASTIPAPFGERVTIPLLDYLGYR